MQPVRTAVVASALLAVAPVAVMAQASQRIEHSVEDVFDQIENRCDGELVSLIATITVTTRRTVGREWRRAPGVEQRSERPGRSPSGGYNVVGTHRCRPERSGDASSSADRELYREDEGPSLRSG